jgi:hypothetical protein
MMSVSEVVGSLFRADRFEVQIAAHLLQRTNSIAILAAAEITAPMEFPAGTGRWFYKVS